MSTEFKVGDKVRRLAGHQHAPWELGTQVLTVCSVDSADDGYLGFEEEDDGTLAGWNARLFESVTTGRTVGDFLFKGESWPLTDPKTGGRKGMRIVRYDLIPPEALAEIAACFGKNLEKYENDENGKANYELGMPYSWHMRAALTHIEKWRSGVDFDEDDDIHHLAHAATLLMFLLTYQARDIGTDDRPLHA